jgi:imidazolonepropionase-like amidohydrolase
MVRSGWVPDAPMSASTRLSALLHQDGVTVLLGTETQQPFVTPGIALPRKFDAFDQAGIPRRDSFRLATATAATVLGLAKVGTMAAGGRAVGRLTCEDVDIR